MARTSDPRVMQQDIELAFYASIQRDLEAITARLDEHHPLRDVPDKLQNLVTYATHEALGQRMMWEVRR